MDTNSLSPHDPGLNKDAASDSYMNQSPGHQGGNTTGGTKENLRVLHCSNLDFSMNFEEVDILSKQFGKVERIRLRIADSEKLDAYIVFDDKKSAENAHCYLNGHNLNGLILQTKLFDIQNLKDDPFDYFTAH